jgi:carboxymethylenebutenolidase
MSAGVLVLHAWWGLNDDVRAYAERLRSEGYVTEVPDLYRGQIATTIADAENLGKGLDGARATTDVDAALTKLAGRGDPVAVLGWSMGASYGLELAQARSADIGALVLYYPGMDDVYTDAKLPPVLVHFADHDEFESLADARRAELVASPRGAAQFHLYPGTKHWFDEPSRPEYDKAASEQAWKRTAAFLDTHLRR